jgi:hypothetical protein
MVRLFGKLIAKRTVRGRFVDVQYDDIGVLVAGDRQPGLSLSRLKDPHAALSENGPQDFARVFGFVND